MIIQQKNIVEATIKWIGTPYRHQASTIGAGCDCLGLLRGVWREIFGKEPMKMPPYRADWRDKKNSGALQMAADKYLIKSETEPQAGDVILFKMIRSLPPKHCAIMISNSVFIHAQEQIGVVEAPLSDAWKKHIFAIYKFPEIAK
ncbi:MAG: NlpC/P60 family protein [Devosiaceae bacterium]|nr:NlpC/P60 family protein [Devosiaceae bacterium]